MSQIPSTPDTLSTQQKFELIEHVRSFPVLWNQKSKEYAVRHKEEYWQEIGKAFNISGTTAKKQWEILRDGFRRERKRIPLGRSGEAAANYTVKWQYYTALQFLDTCSTPRDTTSNIYLIQETDIEVPVINTIDSEVFLRDNYSDMNPIIPSTTDDSETSTPSTSGSSYKRKKCSTLLDLEKKKIELMEERIKKRRELDNVKNPEDYHFLMSLLPDVANIPKQDKAQLKIEILQLIQKFSPIYD